MDAIWEHIITFFIVIGASWLGVFFNSYHKEKGKNVATKEDIEEITSKIESIKTTYQKRHFKSKHYFEKQVMAYEEIDNVLFELAEYCFTQHGKRKLEAEGSKELASEADGPFDFIGWGNKLINTYESKQFYVSEDINEHLTPLLGGALKHTKLKNKDDIPTSLNNLLQALQEMRKAMRKELTSEIL